MTLPANSARQQRYTAFQTFLNSATERFNELCNRHDAAMQLRDIYSLCIAPGGRAGGKNSRQLEVLFGARPYDQQEWFDSSLRPAVKLLAERGATMEFVRDDHGRVHVLLYPAVTEGTKPLEDAIELGVVNDPADLAKEVVLSRYFGLLVAYMQCTCLDGAPTFKDNLAVGKLRHFRRTYVDGRICDSWIWIASRGVFKWGATVGFSGILLATVQWRFSSEGPMAVKVTGEPSHTQQQRNDLINLGRENASRLDALERVLGDIRRRLDAPLVIFPPQTPALIRFGSSGISPSTAPVGLVFDGAVMR
ncbi:DUF2285 domain-containing protein [Pseudomonas prosekii]|nr:DUF2285 domain-containing protein [Pseudomonas prosekii]